jgi:hypothetical protein
LLAVVAAVQGYLTVFCREGDFLCHRSMGQAFLAGDPYGWGNVIYPAGRSLMNVLLAVGPVRPTRATCFVLALLSLYASYRLWARIAQDRLPAAPAVTRAAGLLTVAFVFAYLLRDLDECGLQLFLVFFLSAAAAASAAGRPGWCGFWLATAATYKSTPVLFLPWLLWKRQWRAAGWMAAFLAAWAAAPALFVGVDTTVRSHQRFLAHGQKLAEARKAYPTQLLELPRPYNLSLAALVARNVETYPPGHPLYFDHPLLVQPGSLGPEEAFLAVRGVLLAFGLVLAWRFRRAWPAEGRSGDLAAEWAAASILCAILSPVCWKQHLVVILPAVFLLLRATLATPHPPRLRVAALLGIAGVINLTRDFVVGRDLSTVLVSYKVDTLAILLLLWLVLKVPLGTPAAADSAPTAGLPRAA